MKWLKLFIHKKATISFSHLMFRCISHFQYQFKMERCQNLFNPHSNATWVSYHSSFFRRHCHISITLQILRNWHSGELKRNLSENVSHVLRCRVESPWEVFGQKGLKHLNKTHREKFYCNSVIFIDWLTT